MPASMAFIWTLSMPLSGLRSDLMLKIKLHAT